MKAIWHASQANTNGKLMIIHLKVKLVKLALTTLAKRSQGWKKTDKNLRHQAACRTAWPIMTEQSSNPSAVNSTLYRQLNASKYFLPMNFFHPTTVNFDV